MSGGLGGASAGSRGDDAVGGGGEAGVDGDA